MISSQLQSPHPCVLDPRFRRRAHSSSSSLRRKSTLCGFLEIRSLSLQAQQVEVCSASKLEEKLETSTQRTRNNENSNKWMPVSDNMSCKFGRMSQDDNSEMNGVEGNEHPKKY